MEPLRRLRSLRDSQPADRLAINIIDSHVSGGALYKALKEIRKLMKAEEEQLVINV